MPLDAEQAREFLVQGNRDFAEMTDTRLTGRETRIIPFDPGAFGGGVDAGDAPVQAPFAAVLGCADARVPTEMMFSKGCNELFVVRVAGNLLGSECPGQLAVCRVAFPQNVKTFGCPGACQYVCLPLSPFGELTEKEKGLFTPPEDVEGFRELALRICTGKLVQRLLS